MQNKRSKHRDNRKNNRQDSKVLSSKFKFIANKTDGIKTYFSPILIGLIFIINFLVIAALFLWTKLNSITTSVDVDDFTKDDIDRLGEVISSKLDEFQSPDVVILPSNGHESGAFFTNISAYGWVQIVLFCIVVICAIILIFNLLGRKHGDFINRADQNAGGLRGDLRELLSLEKLSESHENLLNNLVLQGVSREFDAKKNRRITAIGIAVSALLGVISFFNNDSTSTSYHNLLNLIPYAGGQGIVQSSPELAYIVTFEDGMPTTYDDSNRNEISREVGYQIEGLAEALKLCVPGTGNKKLSIAVSGFSSSLNFRGLTISQSNRSNKELAERRELAVKDYLKREICGSRRVCDSQFVDFDAQSNFGSFDEMQLNKPFNDNGEDKSSDAVRYLNQIVMIKVIEKGSCYRS